MTTRWNTFLIYRLWIIHLILRYFALLLFDRCGRIGKIDHCQTDENHPWNRLFTRRMRTISTCRLQQYHTKFNGNHTCHGPTTNRFCRHQQNGKLKNFPHRKWFFNWAFCVFFSSFFWHRYINIFSTPSIIKNKIYTHFNAPHIFQICVGDCTTIFHICISGWRRRFNTWTCSIDENTLGWSRRTEMLCTVRWNGSLFIRLFVRCCCFSINNFFFPTRHTDHANTSSTIRLPII